MNSLPCPNPHCEPRPAAVQFHKSLHQAQADAQAALRAVKGAIRLRKEIEDAGQ